MGAIYDAESLTANATEGFQAGLRAPASQTSWLSASSSLPQMRETERDGLPSQYKDRGILDTGNGDILITKSYFKSLSSVQNTTPLWVV